MRLPVADRLSILADLDGNGTNYGGKDFDDYVVQLAAGADYALTPTTHASLEAVGAHRWYGGDAVTRTIGPRVGLQPTLTPRRRPGVHLQLTRTTPLFSPPYSTSPNGASPPTHTH